MKDIELELGFINSVLKQPDILDDVMDRVTIDDFTGERQLLFENIKEQFFSTGKFSKVEFMRFANKKLGDKADKIFDTIYAMPFEIENIVEKLNTYKVRRQIYEGFKRGNRIIHDEKLTIAEMKSKVEDIILEITGNKEQEQAIKTMEDVAYKAYDQYQQRRKGETTQGLKTFYPSLDGLFRFKPGHLTVLAGATSSGKTAFAVNLMRNIINNTNKPIYFISLEMVDTELFDRILIQESKVSAVDYGLGDVTEPQAKTIEHYYDKIHRKPVLITDKSGLDVSQIKSLCRRANKRFDDRLGLIIIDYLTMIKMESLDTYKTIGRTVTDIRDLAKELHIPILLLHQVNRDLHKRKDPKPKLSDLRDSGEIEERADEVLFVHRPEYYRKFESGEEEEKIQDDVEIIVAKNRTGKTGSVLFTWYPDILLFQDGYLYEKEGPVEVLRKEG